MTRFIPIFTITTFLSIHYGTILYINSSLLGKFFKPDTVSLLFLVGALGNIVLFLLAPKLIEIFGKRLLLIFFLFLALVSTLGLGFAETTFVILISFIAYSSILFIIYYCLDIFLEELSKNGDTGEVRGSYFTFFNLGITLGPLILALFAINNTFNIVYTIAAAILVPPILLTLSSLKSHMPKWHGLHPKHMFLPFKAWWRAKNIRRITLTRLTLEFFFAFMVIYTPIYLHTNIGFEWSELGIIFTVMLLPFIILQWPAGKLADRLYGEKEIMIAGLLITSASLLVMPFLGKYFFFWMIVLFLSRVGASLVEIMTESYFFKQVGAEDTRLISIFRLTRPISVVLAAILGVMIVNLFSLDKIFYVLLVALFYGLKETLLLKDTK